MNTQNSTEKRFALGNSLRPSLGFSSGYPGEEYRAVDGDYCPRRRMTCCCCGERVPGIWHQHWNRDTGYGICAGCVSWQMSRGTSAAEIADLYGIAGINYPAEVSA